ncbi:polymorphic toxin-type HINT domain-containing protein [Actinoplanes sp. GCM10030250]|uniref:polymorphic toxin-type HINT domain-containing protein n=1 Tax=Actinoplanes sp. GCM10030250 TaxID=3273376 RepID=UPI00362205A7
MRNSTVRRISFGLAVVMTGTLLAVQEPAQAGPKPNGPARAPKETPLDVRPVAGRVRGPLQPQVQPTVVRPVAWPAPGEATVNLPAGKEQGAGSLPVRLTRPAAAHDADQGLLGVRTKVLPQASADRLGLTGLLLQLDRAGAGTDRDEVRVAVDGSSFASAVGGGWATRLHLVSLPACALTTPGVAACRQSTVLPGSQADGARVAHAAVTLRKSPTVLAMVAGASGSAGSYTATPLAPSSTWSAGSQSGSFSWSYPLRVPPGINGPAPQLSISYDSGSVDGRTASTNAQPSWLGEGFDLTTGYIERNYVSCQEDQAGGNNSVKTGDLCYKTDDVQLALAGHSGEVIRDAATGKYRLVNDDGSRIERVTGAAGSPDNDGEHWKLTTSDGTQYFFGKRSDSNATWTVPVAGNQAGEPCRAAAFKDSFCDQAWRWYVDHVIDVNGNTMTYKYTRETNRYQQQAAMSGEAKPVAYTAGGHLAEISYGTRTTTEAAKAPALVQFTTAERCTPVPDVFDCAPAKLTAANAARWPDVPFDQICTSATSCGTNGSPTFFSRRRLTSVVTNILTVANQHTPVEQWDFAQDFYDPADGSSGGLQLKGITHTGRYGATTAMPAVTFAYESFRNRVTGLIDGPVMWKPRLTLIKNETGGEISPTYDTTVGAGRLCSSSTLPSSPATNTTRCYPSYWTPVGAANPTLTWFYKYVVTQVNEKDQVGGAVDTVTSIAYLGDAAWRYDDNEMTPPRHRTWSDWRGYGKVEVRRGDSSTPKTLTRTTYLRGMDGNRAANGSTVPAVKVKDSTNTETLDADRANGTALETEVFNGADRVSTTINKPWISAPTATSGTKTATLMGAGVTDEYTTVFGAGERHTRVTVTTDPVYGTTSRIDDQGDTSTTADDMCSQYAYVRNTTAWITATASEEKQFGTACGSAASATPVAHSRSLLDGGAYGDTPVKGLVTEVQQLGEAGFGVRSKATYDAYGRVKSSTDAMDRTTQTAYTQLAVTGQTHPGGTVTVTTTDPLSNKATSEVNPAWGVPVRELDINNRATSLAYDGLGRLTAMWTPSRAKTAYPNTPSMRFGYSVTKSKPSYVWSQEIVAAEVEPPTYRTEYEIFDGMLRPRQAQSPEATAAGGRIVSDTEYDSRGLAVRTGGPYYADGAPAGTLVALTDVQKSAWHQITYDQAERPTLDVFMSAGAEKYRTSTSYGGSYVTVDPPDGQQPTTTWFDARGRTTALWRYAGNSPAGATDETKYTYDALSRLTKLTAGSGASWDYAYDKRGRLIRTDDPDKGVATMTYNENDQVVTSTDARGQTIWTGYDLLGRVTETRRTNASGTQLTSRTYDSIAGAKGKPVSSTRYVNGQQYVQRITEYDEAYRPKSGEIVIPAAEGALQGTYQTKNSYTGNGSVATTDLPPVPQAGLGTEQLRFGYDALVGNPSSLASTATESIVGGVLRSSYGEGLIYGLGRDGKRISFGYAYEEGTRRLLGQTAQRENATGYDVSLSYAYDKGGNVTSATDSPSASGTTAEKQCYTYDAAAQLTAAWTPATNVACSTAPNRSALAGPAPYWHGYTYDTAGNRKTETVYSSWGDTTRAYTYPAVSSTGKGQPHTLTSLVSTPAGGAATTTAYTYDKSGNTMTKAPGQSFTWDEEGRVSAAATNGTNSAYVYDADGERLIRTEGGVKTLYLDNTEVQLTTSTGAVSATRYYEFDGRTVAMRQSGGGLRAVLGDNHESPIFSADFATATDVKRRRYYPFGAERTGFTPVIWPGERGYVDGVKDAATATTHLGAREYDTSTGRFLSVDPVMRAEAPATFNPYVYSQNNPITLSDPSGLEPGSWCRTPACTKHDDGMRAGTEKACSGTCYDNNEPATAQKAAVETAQRNLNAARQKSVEIKARLVETAKKLGKVLMDELGISAGLDCITKGEFGACAETAVNLLMSAIGGMAAKMVAKYAVRWGKGKALAKLLWKLGGDLYDGMKGMFQAEKKLGRAQAMLGRVKSMFRPGKCPDNSFTGNTPVLMADGTKKPIKAVRVGDRVVATDARTGRTAARPVTDLIRHGGPHAMVAVTVQGGATVEATDRHPFYEATSGTYRGAEDLRIGDRLRTPAGGTVGVTALSPYSEDLIAYNLTVADIHTYYVLADSTPVLVHNCGSSLDDLAAAGKAPDKNGFTRAGFEQQKHGNRATNNGQWAVPAGTRNPKGWNGVGQDTLEDILTHPKTATQSYVNRAGDNVKEFLLPDRGVQFRQSGGVGDWVLHSFRES